MFFLLFPITPLTREFCHSFFGCGKIYLPRLMHSAFGPYISQTHWSTVLTVRLPYRNASCIAAKSNQPFSRSLRYAQKKLFSSLHQWTGRLFPYPWDSHNLSDSVFRRRDLLSCRLQSSADSDARLRRQPGETPPGFFRIPCKPCVNHQRNGCCVESEA